MVLEARELKIGFDEANPLQEDLSFRLEEGGRMGIAGPSGCGKTTLLRAVAGLSDPLGGEIELDDRSPSQLGYPAWRRAVTYVHQRPVFFGGRVRDELRRPFGYRSADTDFDEEAARDALERLGVGAKWDAEVEELSVGEGQRVALVRAALIEPRVLLLDEPTSALDAAAAERAEAWLAERSAAIVIVTHQRAQLERFTEDILTLEAR